MPRPAHLRLLLAAVALLAAPAAARADQVTFTGSASSSVGSSVASYSGTLDVQTNTVGSTTTAVITVTLKNTSTGGAATNGFITGFGFNVPHPSGTSAAGSAGPNANYHLLVNGTAGVSTTLQAGAFDYAFSTSTTELHTVNRSNPSDLTLIKAGLGVGQTETFTLTLTGAASGLSGLTALQVIQDTSPATVPFSVRFRSTDLTKYVGNNSPDGDKVPVASYQVVKPVPAPPGLVLAGMGFGCVLLGRFRLRRTAAKA
jgi:hypothetical protein